MFNINVAVQCDFAVGTIITDLLNQVVSRIAYSLNAIAIPS